MDEYGSFTTETFKKIYSSLDGRERIWIDKIKKQLEENPTGRILKFEWFREKKLHDKRLFYLVDEKGKKILFVGFATKKDQQKIISFVIENKDELFLLLRN